MGNIELKEDDALNLGTISLRIHNGEITVTRRVKVQISTENGTTTQSVEHEGHGSDGLTTFDGPKGTAFDADMFSQTVAFRFDEFVDGLREFCIRNEITIEEQTAAERILKEVIDQKFWPPCNHPSRADLTELDRDLNRTTCIAELPTQLHSQPNAPISLLWRARLALLGIRDQLFGH